MTHVAHPAPPASYSCVGSIIRTNLDDDEMAFRAASPT